MYRLTPDVQQSLKDPFGELLKGSQPDVFNPILEELMQAEYVIAVGDMTALNLIRAGIQPGLCVIDEKTKRSRHINGVKETLLDFGYDIVSVTSPASTISDALWSAMDRYIMCREKVAILVYGEEDLATIPAVMLAPNGAVVCYGQPDEGVVVIRVTTEIKDKVKSLLEGMEVMEE